ncbi:hypothetical protein [Sulfurospirillum barnesii]|uniref:Uncharacterized protein n=1 Tax=Sulfurospirillum barnesii (strain ATCC 700032 / DSM 10660 / SES-3) TaxID=760154 RepID=I3XYK0_SULBS|nr:hypothetical protein [Sulfurospirillum barnesii]AFL69024.1 hypothetical protein Sulba_1736 [Sulfurospirillum barnesii SES-3]
MAKCKPLCALKKDDVKSMMKKLIKIVSKPTFICEKCARVANDEDYLCHGIALKTKKEKK